MEPPSNFPSISGQSQVEAETNRLGDEKFVKIGMSGIDEEIVLRRYHGTGNLQHRRSPCGDPAIA